MIYWNFLINYWNNFSIWARAYIRPSPDGIYQEIVVEVSFRKKGFLGAWYNYVSETSLAFEDGSDFRSMRGTSSHDYVWPRIFNSSGPKPFKGRMYIMYQGFGDLCGGPKFFFNVNL